MQVLTLVILECHSHPEHSRRMTDWEEISRSVILLVWQKIHPSTLFQTMI